MQCISYTGVVVVFDYLGNSSILLTLVLDEFVLEIIFVSNRQARFGVSYPLSVSWKFLDRTPSVSIRMFLEKSRRCRPSVCLNCLPSRVLLVKCAHRICSAVWTFPTFWECCFNMSSKYWLWKFSLNLAGKMLLFVHTNGTNGRVIFSFSPFVMRTNSKYRVPGNKHVFELPSNSQTLQNNSVLCRLVGCACVHWIECHLLRETI